MINEKYLTSEVKTKKQSNGDEDLTKGNLVLVKMLLAYAAVLGVVVLIFSQVLMLSLIPSGSMEGTIMTGDMVMATRFDKTDVQRYDTMIFIPPDDPDTYYIKRVIGLPGETITVYDGNVYAGDELLDNSFLPEPMSRSGDGTYQVPEGCYFMMGDNRNHSLDARFWTEKYVPVENMVAKARFTVFPLSHAGSLRYQGPAGGNIVEAPEPGFTPTGDGGNHIWTMIQENNSTDAALYCQGCGRQEHLKQLQVKEDPSDACAQHRIVFAWGGHAENGAWVNDYASLFCNECGWKATAVPAD